MQTHREAAERSVLQSSGRVVDSLPEVPNAAADSAHAEGGADVVENAVRARLATEEKQQQAASDGLANQRQAPQPKATRRAAWGQRQVRHALDTAKSLCTHPWSTLPAMLSPMRYALCCFPP